jgi:hypothetical protein
VCTVTKRVLVVIFGVAVAFAMALAIRLPQASASESPASKASHSASAGVTGPIELGPSQGAQCKRVAPGDRVPLENCLEATRILALMAAEPRDSAWADRTESALSKWIESLASEGATARNVECRLSWCIVELGSANKSLLRLNIREQQNMKIFDRLDLFAPDVDDPTVLDVLRIFKRYCKSTRELFDGDGHLVPDFDALGQKC